MASTEGRGGLSVTAVRIEGVAKTFPSPGGERVEALQRIDLAVEDGEFVCLLGPSGCGKSTLLNIVAGLEAADEGRVDIGGDRASRAVVTYMFQESRLLPWMSVADNLRFVLDAPSERREERVADWLERVGLAGFADYYPQQLSIGMQQRVAVARALIVRPDVLLMDEPFSSLDELTAMSMREQLLELWEELGCTVMFVTHNPLEATLLADRVVVMSAAPGRITDTMDLRGRLPRPRDPDDESMWRLSRRAVAQLRQEAQD
jgi:ABC-type nitrate/sulfonate/bicarbonate transport system ATPase subunit